MTGQESWLLIRPFVSAELFKLRRSRVGKATLVVTAVASPLITGLVWLIGGEKESTFPRVLELIYLPSWLLAGLIGLLLAVEVMGGEFAQGTVRTVMGRGTPRWLFVGGKAVALLVAVTVNAIVCTLSGGVFATVSHLGQLGTAGLAEGWREFARFCLPALGIIILSALAYVGILLLVVVLVRSSALAMLAGLLIFGGDFIIEALGMEGLDPGAYSIYRSTSVLFSQVVKGMESLGMTVEGLGDPGRAFLTLAFYAVAGVVLAYYVFKRQDLAGKQ